MNSIGIWIKLFEIIAIQDKGEERQIGKNKIYIEKKRLKEKGWYFKKMTDKISITFDEDNKIRVLEQDKFKETD